MDRRIKSCPNIQYAKLSLSPKTNLQACPSTDPARPIFWTNRHHWCHWLESAEHMDPWRHHGASSLLPALNQARLLSLCAPSVELRGPTGSPIPPAPGLPGVGQYGAQRRGCKVKTALRLPSLPLEYLNGSRHRNPYSYSCTVTVWAWMEWRLIYTSLLRYWNNSEVVMEKMKFRLN